VPPHDWMTDNPQMEETFVDKIVSKITTTTIKNLDSQLYFSFCWKVQTLKGKIVS
jgi:hypothetical protein